MRPELLAALGVYADYILTISFSSFEANPIVRIMLRFNPLVWLTVYVLAVFMLIRVNRRLDPRLAYLPAIVPLAASLFNLVGVVVFELG